jgi:hypothetical protein
MFAVFRQHNQLLGKYDPAVDAAATDKEEFCERRLYDA